MEITGKVTALEQNEAGWWKIKVGGKTLDTKIDEIVGGMEAGMNIAAECKVSKNGKYTNYQLQEWHEVDGAAPAAPRPAKPGSNAAPADSSADDPWEAKDRRIAMESAYSTAARYMQALATAGNIPDNALFEDFQSVAQSIYADVLKAGRGEPFDAQKAARELFPKDAPTPTGPPAERAPVGSNGASKPSVVAELMHLSDVLGWSKDDLKVWCQENGHMEGSKVLPSAVAALRSLVVQRDQELPF